MLKNLKLSVNLFRVILEPLFLLGATLFARASNASKERFLRAYRTAFKKFCLLPRSTAERVLSPIMGDFGRILMTHNLLASERATLRMGAAPPPRNRGSERPDRLSHFPNRTIDLVRLLYDGVCRQHSTFAGISHLVHFHNLDLPVVRWIERFQVERNRRSINRLVAEAIKSVEAIKVLAPRQRSIKPIQGSGSV